MNKYRITNPYNNIVRDCKSRTTEVGKESNFYQNIETKEMNGNTIENGIKLKDNPNNLFIDNRKKK